MRHLSTLAEGVPSRRFARGRSFGFALCIGLCFAATAGAQTYDPERLLAGHLLRRISFGPTQAEVAAVLANGRAAYVERQLQPQSIDDSSAEAALPKNPRNMYDDYGRQRRWYARMVLSRRQLQERMALIWHEHFATSNEKVGIALLMQKQEELLRARALSRFRDFLIDVTTDQAMLIWLDNDYNDGNATDDAGHRVLPNANYAREFLQLFTLGPVLLHPDGTPVRDGSGVPIPTYTEQDVKEVARALTGWHVDYQHRRYTRGIFEAGAHDDGGKSFLGHSIAGRGGADGANEVADVIDIVMQHQNAAPFISKMLIQKLATETPTPAYVQRVAGVFSASGSDIKATVRAILNDAEFVSPAVVRSQFKEPIEYFVGPARALGASTGGAAFIAWTDKAHQLLYYPPSVFSFYPPGQKRTLVNTALLNYRDRALDDFTAGSTDTRFSPRKLRRAAGLTTPAQVVDYLAERLLVAPPTPELRDQLIAYMDGSVSDEKLRGAAWLLTCSPDFQRN